MHNNRNPFGKKTLRRIRRRPNRQRQTERQLQEALAQIEQLKHLEETVLDDERKRSMEEQKQKEAAEAAAVADETQKARIESLVRDAIEKNSVRQLEAVASHSAVGEVNQKQSNDAKSAGPKEEKKPWYRRMCNFQY